MSLVDPKHHKNSPWYNLIHQHILAGLQQAAVVFYTTHEVRRQIETYQVVSCERLVQVPLGVAPEFQERSPGVSDQSQTVLKRLGETRFLLMVGGSTQRKRLDVVLEVLREVRNRFPEIKLVRVGRKPDDWKESHLQQIKAGQLEDSIMYFHNLDRETLAELYRRSDVVMVASEAEGFGLPVIEALACGAVVVASDIPVLREVGGSGAVFCAVGDVHIWAEKIMQILSDPSAVPPKEIRIDQVKKYSWKNHVDIIANTYANL
ncbi:MAG: glycosyltransferase family 4 protein [Synechococcaceae cyanobacterium SM2_3_1]|nr:glycosyltransferase family 4 protein [Synechococcaceae cyanobacterium SM2_3_1]